MKVAVLGSWRPKNKDTWNLEYGINEFKNACESIGAFLDSEGHTLVTALQQEDTADLYAARAFTDQNRLITYDKILGRENLLAAHNVASLNAQAIIIIGGAVGSYNAGLMALNANKLVIPIACFGGAARQLLSNPIRNKFSGIICNTLCDLDLHKDGWQKTLTNNIDKLLDKYPRILIIHGRSPDREKLFDLIKNKLTKEQAN